MKPPKIEWINFKGKEILFNDRNGFNSEEIIASVDAAYELIINSNKKDILYLVDSSNNFIIPDVKDHIKKTGKKLNPYLKKSAVVGITGSQKILINILSSFARLNIKIFNDIDSAKEWLVK